MNFNELFQKADYLKTELSQYRPLTDGEVDMLREAFIINNTYNSNAIEGNTLTLDETALVIGEGITIGGKSIKEHLEVVGHRDAFLYIEDLVREKVALSEKIIKDIHTSVLMDRQYDRGIYRRLPVMITGSPAEIPEPWEVPIKMEQLMLHYHEQMQTLHPIERAATFHLLFESIHPFIDGNGRTGRLIMNLELMKEGYPPIDVKFTDRKNYIDAFKPWHLTGDDSIMVSLVGNYVTKRLEEYIELLIIAGQHEQDTEPEI